MAKHGKLKSGTKKKLNRWKKGQSSSSNPATSSHRQNAKSKFFHMVPKTKKKPGTGLTMEKLSLHDEMMDEKDSVSFPSSQDGSEGGETFGTFLSGVSDCSNVTFRKIQSYWRKNSAKHKEVCAVLAAITEVIRMNGGAESDVAYFAALVTALEAVNGAEPAAACSYLLSMTIKKVPAGVLQAKFSVVSKLFCDRLNEYSQTMDGSAPAALLRLLLICLSTLLRHQSQYTWAQESTLNVFQTILNFTTHAKPKVRKSAMNGICAIIKASDIMTQESPPQFHPATKPLCQFAVQCIEKYGTITANASSSACHMVSLLGSVMHLFPSTMLKTSCETILKLMTLSLPIVKSVCFQALHQMFKNNPPSKSLPSLLNGQIIMAMYDYHPSDSDLQMTAAWLTVMQAAIVHLLVNNVKDLSMGFNHVKKIIIVCMKLMSHNIRELAESASSTIKYILTNGVLKIKEDAEKQLPPFVDELLKHLETGFNYKYHAVWDLVFDIFITVYKHLISKENFNMAKQGLCTMADLRNTPLFSFKEKLDATIGAAISSIGPKLVLEAIPLMIDGSEQDYVDNFPRSWLLPILRDNTKHTELQFFVSHFLPLAAKLKMRSVQLLSEKRAAEAKTYEVIQLQMWSLLPGFMEEATDIHVAFPVIARTLGSAIQDRNDLRTIAMQAVRIGLMSCSKNEQNKETMNRFAKNFLPILFNLYLGSNTTAKTQDVEMADATVPSSDSKKSPERLAALETIRLYFKVADPSLVEMYFQRAQTRAFDDESESFANRLCLLDMVIAMTPYLSIDSTQGLFEKIKTLLTSDKQSLQKKAYRVLEELCGSTHFVEKNLKDVKTLLLDGLSMACQSAKGPRIKCMERIIQILSDNKDAGECEKFIESVLPEVILCIREAKRSRMAGFSFLVLSCKLFVDLRSQDEDDIEQNTAEALNDYFKLVFAGLAGSPMMINATIITLSRLVYEYRATIPSSLLNDVIHNVSLLLGTNTREVCKAALGFVNVLMGILDRATLAQHVKAIMESLFNWNPATRRHFRFKVKQLLQRLVKKFGYEMIYSLAPEDHKKQLANMRKTSAREKRQKLEGKKSATTKTKKQKPDSVEELLAESDSEDSGDEDVDDSAESRHAPAWIKQDNDEPIDLLSASMSKNIVGNNPNKSKKRKASNEDAFKTSSDGRLLISLNDDEDENNNKEMKMELAKIGLNAEKAENITSGSKRKLDDEDSEEETGYKPGGKGIHRNLNEDEEDFGHVYKAKKAKGDIKKKGMPDPYAYVPLNPASLNKRKSKKLTGQYKGLVRAAKFGSAKGRKAKTSNKKKMK